MFSFNHVTSITVTAAEYAKLSPEQQAKCELKSDKTTYYMRIGTTISLPETADEIKAVCDKMTEIVEMSFDKHDVKYPQWFAHTVVGWKLSINQSVQADYRNGSKTSQRAETLKWYCEGSAERTMEYMQMAMAATTPALAKARDAWLDAKTTERLAGKTLSK